MMAVLVIAIALVAAGVLFMVCVDPYAVYRPGNVGRRRATLLLDRGFATSLLRRRSASTVIVGTSDVLQGLVAHQDILGTPVLVCGLQAARVTRLGPLAAAIAAKPPTREIIFAVDLVSFGAPRRSDRRGGFGPLPGASRFEWMVQHAAMARQTIFNRAAVNAAIATLRDPSGSWVRQKYDMPFELAYHADGSATYTYFDDDPANPLWFLVDRHRQLPWLLGDYHLSELELDAFAHLVKSSAFEHTRLTLFIHPYHPALALLVDELGLWPVLETWKDRLVATVAEASANVRIFDLTSFDSPWSAALGAADAAFIDAVHLTEHGGRELLRQLFAPDSANAPAPLTPACLASHHERLRAARDAYRLRQPAIAARVAAIAKEPRRKKPAA